MSNMHYEGAGEADRSSSATGLLIRTSYGIERPPRMDTGIDVGGSGDSLSLSPELTNYDLDTKSGELTVKVICLGDSAVGKSKLLERYLVDAYKPKQVSTFALTLYKHTTTVGGKPVVVDFWDTAGQERFSSLHPSYYYQAHACIMVFDATRKVTYKNLTLWYKELREFRPEIPCFLAVNKIDANSEIGKRVFAFPEKNNIPFYHVSASTGANVVTLFQHAIAAAVQYKKDPTDWKDQVLSELDTSNNTLKMTRSS